MSHPTIKTITCQELYQLSRSEPIELIDVRTPEEFRDRRVIGARSVPLDSPELLAMIHKPDDNSAEPLYIICEMGGRSAWACASFMAAGHPNVINVEGGTQAWAEAGFPTAAGE
jgi:rhodanese-related sulfurtransferase